MGWRKGRQRGVEAVVMFEDDVVLTRNFRAKVAALAVPEDWDVVYFGCTFLDAPKYLGGGVVRVAGKTWNFHAVAVHQRVWPRLHALYAPWSRTNAVWSDAVSNDNLVASIHGEMNVYAAWPPLAWQRTGWSNLENAVVGLWSPEGRQLFNPEVVAHLPEEGGA